MLTSITLKDYTTFIKERTFDFKATNYKILEETNVGEDRVLKGALFIGENASGKTQALKAIKLLLDLLLGNSEQNFIAKKSLYTKGTKFSLIYTFDVKKNIIKYEVTFNANSISSEKLYLNDEMKLNRLKENGETYFGEEKEIKDVNDNLSLLKLEYYNTRFYNDPILNEWFDFLKNSLYVDCMSGRIESYNVSRLQEQLISKYAEKNDASKLNQLMEKLGYNSEIVFTKTTGNTDNTIMLSTEKSEVNLRKKGTKISVPLLLESVGNKVFVNLLLPFNYATKNNCMIIVDEFSSGLHNELEEALVRYFFNNSKNSQLFLLPIRLIY